MSYVLASARDSSGKPTARNERGLVADSPVALRLAWPGRPTFAKALVGKPKEK